MQNFDLNVHNGGIERKKEKKKKASFVDVLQRFRHTQIVRNLPICIRDARIMRLEKGVHLIQDIVLILRLIFVLIRIIVIGLVLVSSVVNRERRALHERMRCDRRLRDRVDAAWR